MARLSEEVRADKEQLRLIRQLMEYYKASLQLMPPTDKPGEVRAVIDAGVRLISFLRSIPSSTGDTIDGMRKKAPSLADLTEAFKALESVSDAENPVDDADNIHNATP